MNPRASWVPLGMTGPALVLFTVMLLVPLALSVILSFNAFDADTGPIAGSFTVEHYVQVVQDPYYYEIFWRTLKLSALVTLVCILVGAPEAYILSRMGKPWRSIFLLIILAPLLISVVVRTFGWSMLLGPEGLINGALQSVGLGPVRLLYNETAIAFILLVANLIIMLGWNRVVEGRYRKTLG